jgi:hypothetical protein
LLDEFAGDAAPAELDRKREPDRPAADDKNGNSAHRQDFGASPISW